MSIRVPFIVFWVFGREISDRGWWWYPCWYLLVCIRLVIIGNPSMSELVMVYMVYFELVLVLILSIKLVVFIVLVELVFGILE